MNGLTEAVWRDVLEQVRTNDPDVVAGWFTQLVPADLNHGQLTVLVRDEKQQRYLEDMAKSAFVDAVRMVTGRLVSVRFEMDTGVGKEGGGLSATAGVASTSGSYKNTPEMWSSGELRLVSDYTFENFVVGPENRMGHAAAVAVSEAPGKSYNPLFIHGGVGLGKTHLLQAACHVILRDRPEALLMYLSCETFVNHYVEALEKGLLNQFRYRYRHVDVLAIDDIQFLGKRERTQEEFFHTFNTLYQNQKQIIMSADAPPSEIPSLEDRLVSRFNSGLVVRIDEPSMETRMAILRKKSAMRGITMPDDVVQFVAQRVSSNARELEGAINRVMGHAHLRPDHTITLEVAQEALGDLPNSRAREVSLHTITQAVSAHFGLKQSDLQGKRRTKSVAYPRQICMYLARTLTRMSLEEIGVYFGGRDHTTVLHAHRSIEQGRKKGNELDKLLEQLAGEICSKA